MGRLLGKVLAAITFLAITCAVVATEAPATQPIVPGYHILKESGKVDLAAQGELLLQELNCVACHTAPGDRLEKKGGPNLSAAANRITPQYIQRFLADPHTIKPGTTMPDLLHGMLAAEKAQVVDALTHFLMSQGSVGERISAGTAEQAKEGETLFSKVGCAVCHAAGKQPDSKLPPVPLGNQAMKTTLSNLTAFLLDPAHDRPAGRMPGMGLTRTEARAIATFLLRKQIDEKAANSQPLVGTGLRCEYYEEAFESAAPELFAAFKPKRATDVATISLEPAGKKPKSQFALKFTGWIWIPQDGKYTFTLKSDDGSILFINGKQIVNYDGKHPNNDRSAEVELTAGVYPLLLTFFQNGGGVALQAFWSGPGFDKEPIPTDVLAARMATAMSPLHTERFAVDPAKAQEGARRFQSLGCAACHSLKDHTSQLQAKPLVALKPERGCLAENVEAGRPHFGLWPDQRAAITAALQKTAAFAMPRPPADQAIHTLAAMNCLACHQRNGVGGVTPERDGMFKLAQPVDVGDEGRLPPLLTFAGAKLQPAVMEKIIFQGQLHVRPWMGTRMPIFSKAVLGGLIETLVKADADVLGNVTTVKVAKEAEKDGRTLVGVRGYGCVNCHGAKGAKSLGAPSVDFSTVRARLQPAWFAAYLADPNKLKPETRMPAFWPDGVASIKELAGGTFTEQTDAIWSYFQKIDDMPLPDGLKLNGSDEIVPSDEPIVMRAFMTDVSPRSILVGNPAGLHCVFDANSVRLAKAWRGRFFDAKGIWEARGGRAEPPLSSNVIDMPIGPSFTVLNSMAAQWPESKDIFDRNQGGQFLGYTLDEKQNPTFRYRNGQITVEEKTLPIGSGEKAALQRQFSVTASADTKDLFFLIASGKKIEAKGPGVWLVDGKQTIKLTGHNLPEPQQRDGKDGIKLLVMPVTGKSLAFSVETNW